MKEEWVKTLTRIPRAGLRAKFLSGNVLGTLMHNPRTLGTFLDYWVTSKSETGFPVREQELIILSVGFLYKSDHLWRHHVPVAREFGVTEEEIAAVKTSPLLLVFSKREAALLKLTNEMVENGTVRPEVWEECKGVLSKSEWFKMGTIVSQYVLFALVNNSMQVQLEVPLQEIPAL
jgi:alkylhydroperoxidase family enzyme